MDTGQTEDGHGRDNREKLQKLKKAINEIFSNVAPDQREKLASQLLESHRTSGNEQVAPRDDTVPGNEREHPRMNSIRRKDGAGPPRFASPSLAQQDTDSRIQPPPKSRSEQQERIAESYRSKGWEYLQCYDVFDQITAEEWSDMNTIIEMAKDYGANESGVFVVKLPEGIEGAHINQEIAILAETRRKFNSKEFHEPRLTKSVEGIWNYDIVPIMHHGMVPMMARPDTEPIHDGPATIMKFLDILKGPDAFRWLPRYGTNIDAGGISMGCKDNQQRINTSLYPRSVFDTFEENGLLTCKERYPGISSPELFMSTEGFGAPFGVHKEEFDLISMNYMIRGAAKIWIVVSPEDMEKFEDAVEEAQSLEQYCHQFVRHTYCWISPEFLEKSGIRYTIVCQNQGDVVITMPKAYHWGINTGANIAEAVNWADKSYEPPEDYEDCFKGCGSNARLHMKADNLRQFLSDDEDSEIEGNGPPEDAESAQAKGKKSKSKSKSKSNTKSGSSGETRKRKALDTELNDTAKRTRNSHSGRHHLPINDQRIVNANNCGDFVIDRLEEIGEKIGSLVELKMSINQNFQPYQTGKPLELLPGVLKKNSSITLQAAAQCVQITVETAGPDALMKIRTALIALRAGNLASGFRFTQVVGVNRWKCFAAVEREETFSQLVYRFLLCDYAEFAFNNRNPRGKSTVTEEWNVVLKELEDSKILPQEDAEDPKVGQNIARIKRQAGDRLRNGRKWRSLVLEFGLAILALIPLENKYTTWINDLSRLEIDDLATLMAQKRYPFVKPMSEKFSKFLGKAWSNGLKGSPRIMLETLKRSEILGEPDGSPIHQTRFDEVAEEPEE